MATNCFAEADVQQILDNIARENGFKNPQYMITPATKAGDNFVGRVLRVVISEKGSAEKASISLIFKTAPVSQARRIGFRSSVIFRNEGNMYQIVLPALNAFLREHSLSDVSIFPSTARCYAAKLYDDPLVDQLDVIVLEDMAVKGYGMLDRASGLDTDSCRVILRELARLHSASLGLRRLKPKEADRIENSIKEVCFSRENPFIDQMQPIVEQTAPLTLERFPEGTPENVKLRKFLDKYVDELCFLVRPNTDLSCVTHGDCWSNNVLFDLSEKDNADKICLIDFQLGRVASPVIDLLYLIFTCTTKQVRDAHYEGLIRYYHNELSSNLKKMGLDPENICSWSLLQDQLKTYGRYGLTMALFTTAFMLADSSEAPQDIDGMMEKNSDVSEVFNSIKTKHIDTCKERLSDVLLDSIKLGYI